MAFQEIVQLIGIAAAFPVLLLVGFILFAPVGVYEGGELPASLLFLLKRELRLRVEDRTEELSQKTLERLARIIKTYETSADTAQAGDLRGFDAAMIALTDNTVDSAFLAQRRDQLQLLVQERLRERCRETSLATDLIRRWQYWVMLEKTRLYRAAVQDVGIKAFRHFMRTVGQCMTDAGAFGIIIGVLIWGLSLSRPDDNPMFLVYLGNSGALGAFIGLAYALTLLARKAWRQYMATIPTDERDGWRRSGIVLLAFMFGMGPLLYFGLLQEVPTWMDQLLRPLLEREGVSDVLMILYLVGIGSFFLLGARAALRNWRTPGILTRPQRLEQLSTAILGMVLAVVFMGILGFWLAGDRPTQSRYLMWWGYLILTALLSAAGVEAMAGLTRNREHRSRTRMFKELGLQPKQFRPIWLIVVMWFLATLLAVPVTALIITLILVLGPGMAEDGEIPTWVLPVLACVQGLVAAGGISHFFLAKRRRRLEERRLIAEYRRLLWANPSGANNSAPSQP